MTDVEASEKSFSDAQPSQGPQSPQSPQPPQPPQSPQHPQPPQSPQHPQPPQPPQHPQPPQGPPANNFASQFNHFPSDILMQSYLYVNAMMNPFVWNQHNMMMMPPQPFPMAMFPSPLSQLMAANAVILHHHQEHLRHLMMNHQSLHPYHNYAPNVFGSGPQWSEMILVYPDGTTQKTVFKSPVRLNSFFKT